MATNIEKDAGKDGIYLKFKKIFGSKGMSMVDRPIRSCHFRGVLKGWCEGVVIGLD